jgi:hypothetical protein
VPIGDDFRRSLLGRPAPGSMTLSVVKRRAIFLNRFVPPVAALAFFSACASSYSIPASGGYELEEPHPTNISCEVSGGTTTATGSLTGPATAVIVLSAQNSAGRTIGSTGRTTRSVSVRPHLELDHQHKTRRSSSQPRASSTPTRSTQSNRPPISTFPSVPSRDTGRYSGPGIPGRTRATTR